MADQPSFSLEKIYVKHFSIDCPASPEIFLERIEPTVHMQLGVGTRNIDEAHYESAVTITVTAKLQDKTQYVVKAVHAGIFKLVNVPAADVGPLLNVGGPNIVFPYIRELISDAVIRAGFPPMLLTPVNFEALYQARQLEAA